MLERKFSPLSQEVNDAYSSRGFKGKRKIGESGATECNQKRLSDRPVGEWCYMGG